MIRGIFDMMAGDEDEKMTWLRRLTDDESWPYHGLAHSLAADISVAHNIVADLLYSIIPVGVD